MNFLFRFSPGLFAGLSKTRIRFSLNNSFVDFAALDEARLCEKMNSLSLKLSSMYEIQSIMIDSNINQSYQKADMQLQTITNWDNFTHFITHLAIYIPDDFCYM